MTRQQVRLRSFMHSLLSVQDDNKAIAAAADAAAFGMFNAACSSLQTTSSPSPLSASSCDSSSISSAHESTLLFPASVSSIHALALFCVLASQVIGSCAALSVPVHNCLSLAASRGPTVGMVLQVPLEPTNTL